MATTDDELVSLIGQWTTEWHMKVTSPDAGQGDFPSKSTYLAQKIVEFYEPIIEAATEEAYADGRAAENWALTHSCFGKPRLVKEEDNGR